MKCYRCDAELTAANRSKEHIIQDAIGGPIVSWDILCHDCNLWFGREVDPAFTQFTSYIYRLVLQARPTARVGDRLVGVTESGAEVTFGPRMKQDTLIRLEMPDGMVVEFSAKPEEAEKKALKKLRQLKGKYKDLDPEAMLAKAQRGVMPLEDLIYFSNYEPTRSMMGGPPFFRGIKKIAVNFYLSHGHAQHYVQTVIDQVVNGVPAPYKISTFYYARPVHEVGEQEISHVIKLVGNPAIGLLYCYVELFNINHSLILLNKHYYGPEIDEQFCYDALADQVVVKPMDLSFDNRMYFLRLFEHEWVTNPAGQAAYDRTRKIIVDIFKERGYVKE